MNVAPWPGQRLGLPEHGSGSVAGWGRRLLALTIDWFGSLMVVGLFLGTDLWSGAGAAQWAPLLVFAIERWLLTSLSGGSAGQLVTRVRVVRTDGSRLDPGRALVRTVLLCLVVPPVVYNRDQRGLHDLAVDSVSVRV
jgi:uncharacterized RDD family membrane protein YckC